MKKYNRQKNHLYTNGKDVVYITEVSQCGLENITCKNCLKRLRKFYLSKKGKKLLKK